MTKRRRWSLALAGVLLAAALLATGYRSHRELSQSLVETFVAQQSMFIHALGNAVRDFVRAGERDMAHLVSQLLSEPGPFSPAPGRLAALHAAHLDGFRSVSIHDAAGGLLAACLPADAEDETLQAWIRDTIQALRGHPEPFVSESVVGRDYKTSVYLFVPFDAPGAPGCWAVGSLVVEDFLASHLAVWKGRSMGVVLADDGGEILSILNTSHESDARMKLGNLHDLDEPCLRCHTAGEFEDIARALSTGEVEHSLFTPPGSAVAFNRATLAVRVRNERWVISLISPFEGVQSAVDRQGTVQLAYAVVALLILGSLGYAVHRVVELESVAATNEALRVTTERLAEANRVKDLFTDIVRHDLMSPLSAAIGYAELLREADCAPAGAKILPPLRRVLGKARAIVESSATLSQLGDVATLELREGDLAEVIDGALGQQAAALRAAGLAVSRELTGEYRVRMNRPLLEEVFANLLANTVKYAPAGGRIEVGIAARGDRWVAAVKDWGEGIPDAAKERVFDRLARLNKEGIKGSGLGLAIVRRVVSLHGGTVWVEDNPEGGCIFNVALPKAGAPSRT